MQANIPFDNAALKSIKSVSLNLRTQPRSLLFAAVSEHNIPIYVLQKVSDAEGAFEVCWKLSGNECAAICYYLDSEPTVRKTAIDQNLTLAKQVVAFIGGMCGELKFHVTPYNFLYLNQKDVVNIEKSIELTRLLSPPQMANKMRASKPTDKIIFPIGVQWEGVQITFTDDFCVQIRAKNTQNSSKAHFSSLGFNDDRNKALIKPTRLWDLLKLFAKLYSGISHNDYKELISADANAKSRRDNLKKDISDLRGILKAVTNLETDPFFPYDKRAALYKPRFHVIDRSGIESETNQSVYDIWAHQKP